MIPFYWVSLHAEICRERNIIRLLYTICCFSIVFVRWLFRVLLRYVFTAFIQRSISKVDLLRQVPNDYRYRTLNVEVEGQ